MQLSGEGKYNLNVLKEIEVSDDFLGLDQEQKECQNETTLQECKSKLYIDTLLDKCGCLPLGLRISNEVKVERKVLNN